MTALAIFIGGGLGSVLRYFTTKFGNQLTSSNLPYGTILSNIIACVLLAVFLILFKNQIKASGFMTNLLVIGLCGGYSTFSTFSLETVNLIDQGQPILALLNVAISIGACFTLIWFILKT